MANAIVVRPYVPQRIRAVLGAGSDAEVALVGASIMQDGRRALDAWGIVWAAGFSAGAPVRGDPQSVPCRVCSAPAGEACRLVVTDGRPTDEHPPRWGDVERALIGAQTEQVV